MQLAGIAFFRKAGKNRINVIGAMLVSVPVIVFSYERVRIGVALRLRPAHRTTQWRILIWLLPKDLKEGKGTPLVAYARRCKLDKYMKLVSEAT